MFRLCETFFYFASFWLHTKYMLFVIMQQDGRFIEELFVKLTDDEISDDKRKEAV